MATRRKRGGETCSAIGCTNARYKHDCVGMSFFRFPRDEARCRQWVLNTNREDLLDKSAAKLYKGGYLLCCKHFERKHFLCPDDPRKRLAWDAVPTIFDDPSLMPARPSRKKKPIGTSLGPPCKRQQLSETGNPAFELSRNDPDIISSPVADHEHGMDLSVSGVRISDREQRLHEGESDTETSRSCVEVEDMEVPSVKNPSTATAIKVPFFKQGTCISRNSERQQLQPDGYAKRDAETSGYMVDSVEEMEDHTVQENPSSSTTSKVPFFKKGTYENNVINKT